MSDRKQNIVRSDELPASSAQSAAIDAHKQAHAGGAPSNDDITSLNKLLQWSTAHSNPDTATGTNATADASSTSATTPNAATPRALDRKWLDEVFPDMNAGVKLALSSLSTSLKGSSDADADSAAQSLANVEEFMADVNYARNIGPLRVLPPVLTALRHTHGKVRAAAAWAVGSLLQDMPENCTAFSKAGGLPLLVDALVDDDAAVRAKAIRASSALLRAAPEQIRDEFRAAGADTRLVAAVGDSDARVRARMCFFVAHAAHSGNAWLLDDVRIDGGDALLRAVQGVDAEEAAVVEPIAGAVRALIERDRAALVDSIPELPDELRALSSRIEDAELRLVVEDVIKALK